MKHMQGLGSAETVEEERHTVKINKKWPLQTKNFLFLKKNIFVTIIHTESFMAEHKGVTLECSDRALSRERKREGGLSTQLHKGGWGLIRKSGRARRGNVKSNCSAPAFFPPL